MTSTGLGLGVPMAKKSYLEGYIDVPEHRLQEVLNALDKHVHLTKRERGCLAFDVWQDDDLPTRLNVSEIYRDREAFEAHLERTKASDWYKVTIDIERHYSIKEA